MKHSTLPASHDPIGVWAHMTANALFPKRSKAPEADTRPSRSLFDLLDLWLWNSRQRDLERVLASAKDVAEVEAILQARERQILQRYY